jgi:myo-inositol-1(or 4)-monophosphatase
MSDFTTDLKTARIAAEQASAIIKTGFTQHFHTEQKEDESVVTSIDHAAEDVIIKTLREHSQHAILSEEAGTLAGHTEFTWVIDPLDGTSNFARHFRPFAVSIALMHGDESLLGVIQNPMTGELYHASKGDGAFYNGRQIQAATVESIKKPLLIYDHGHLDEHKEIINKVIDELIMDFGLRTWGTTAWEMCAVAAGSVDAFICVGDKLWDFAAAMCIVKEAGYFFTDWQGRPWDNSTSYILAAHPAVHKVIVNKVSGLC